MIFGTQLYSSLNRSPETLIRETMRQMSAQGSPLPKQLNVQGSPLPTCRQLSVQCSPLPRQLSMQGSPVPGEMSVQGSPLPVHTGEHPPLLKRSDGSEDSQTSMDGTNPPTRTQSTTQPSQVYTLYI